MKTENIEVKGKVAVSTTQPSAVLNILNGGKVGIEFTQWEILKINFWYYCAKIKQFYYSIRRFFTRQLVI
jgi:hypothetical protein